VNAPGCRDELPHLRPEEQHKRDVGEWVEAQEKRVRQRWGRRRCPAKRPQGQKKVARRPGEECAAEDQRYRPAAAAADRPSQAQGAGDDLEACGHPVVDQRPGLVGAAEDQRREVGDDQDTQQSVDSPKHRGAAVDPRGNGLPAIQGSGGRHPTSLGEELST